MCGIAGIFDPAGEGLVSPDDLRKMAAKLRHRGPDDEGFFEAPGLQFAFRRLSIIDVAGGRQPMQTDDGSVVSICNGEIYNYRELRSDLEQRGCRFRTNCDVEVIPYLYREYGPEFVGRLNGQFAFAAYNVCERRLMLARDPTGIAPLFVARCGKGLLFASEIKAILEHPKSPRAVDLTGLDQVLTFPGTVSPRTLFRGIESIPPGTKLVCDDAGRMVAETYWDLDYPAAGASPLPRDEKSFVDDLESALLNAVERRLRSDVPMALYISGGLDSSLIAAMARKLSPAQVQDSFGIAFTDPALDELRFQQLVAERLGTRHHHVTVDPSTILNRLHDIVVHAEAPLRESYDACSLVLSQHVHENGIKVVLTGEGADELFGGYVGYRLDLHRSNTDDDPADLDALLENETRERLWGDSSFFYEKPYVAFNEFKTSLYSTGVREQFAAFDCLNRSPVNRARLTGRHALHKRSYLDFKLRLADHLLADHGDRVAYANSVEARYPFLDPDVIAVATTVPPELMLKTGTEKYLLKRVAERYLPREIVERQKFSFVGPGGPALLRARHNWVEDLLSPERIRRQGYFDTDAVEAMKSQYRRSDFTLNQTFDDDPLMVVLTFSIFQDAFGLPDFS